MRAQELLLQALYYIKDSGPVLFQLGICGNVESFLGDETCDDELDEVLELLRSTFVAFGLDSQYPLSNGNRYVYDAQAMGGRLWDEKHGRMELVSKLILHLEES